MRVNLQVLPQVRHSCVRAAAPLSVAALAVAMVVSPLGCGDGPTKTKEKSLTTTSTSSPSNGLDLVDPADDAFGDMPAAKSGAKRGAGAPATAAATGSTASSSGKGRWSVMIATFSQEDHAERAAAFRTQLVREYPELSSATVRRVGKGSAIVLGRFEAPDD